MTTKEKFTLTLANFTMENCYFDVGRYNNGNLALQIYCDDEYEGDLVCTCSVNGDRMNGAWEMGIKNYSENEGMVKFLQDMDIIEDEPIEVEHSGFVLIPYYNLTEKGKGLFKKMIDREMCR